MAKIKIQKKDIWIDMTPMSDVMTLLLCFFMLTSTFLTPEPVSVTAPNSVSELKIPEQDVLNILVTPEGRVYCGTENKNNMQAMLDAMTDKFGIQLNANQVKHFREDAMVGAPMEKLSAYLSHLRFKPQRGLIYNHLKLYKSVLVWLKLRYRKKTSGLT